MEQSIQSGPTKKRHHRAVYIAPQDRDKDDPFAAVSMEEEKPPPEARGEIDTSNDKRTQGNIPPHFGQI